ATGNRRRPPPGRATSWRGKVGAPQGKKPMVPAPPKNPAPRRNPRHQAPLQPGGAVTCFEIFLILSESSGSEGTTAMSEISTSNRTRIILAALVLILGAFWAGARFAPRQPTSVEALPLGGAAAAKSIAERDSALTDDESINVRI